MWLYYNYWVVLCSIIGLTLSTDCPSGFVKGPKDGKWGQIPTTTESGWIIRGNSNFWTMTAFSNAQGAGDIFKYKCGDSYGRIKDGGKICCHSAKTSETGFDLRKLEGPYDDEIVWPWVTTDSPFMVSYGSTAYGFQSTVVHAKSVHDKIPCTMGDGNSDTFARRNDVQKNDADHACYRARTGQIPLSLEAIEDSVNGWTNCGQDGKSCKQVTFSDTPRWFKFGSADRYIYTLILNLNPAADTFNCGQHVAGGYNPNRAVSETNFCYISEPVYQFYTPVGFWKKIFNCGGCDENEFKTTEIFTLSTSETVTSELWASLTMTMTEKSNFGLEEVTAELKEEVGARITRSITNSMTYETDSEETHVCNKRAFFQWVTDTKVYTIAGSTYVSTISSKDYECIDVDGEPQCPPHYCFDDDCQTCKCNVYASDSDPVDDCVGVTAQNDHLNFEGLSNDFINDNGYVQLEGPALYLLLIVGICLIINLCFSSINCFLWASKSKSESQTVTYENKTIV